MRKSDFAQKVLKNWKVESQTWEQARFETGLFEFVENGMTVKWLEKLLEEYSQSNEEFNPEPFIQALRRRKKIINTTEADYFLPTSDGGPRKDLHRSYANSLCVIIAQELSDIAKTKKASRTPTSFLCPDLSQTPDPSINEDLQKKLPLNSHNLLKYRLLDTFNSQSKEVAEFLISQKFDLPMFCKMMIRDINGIPADDAAIDPIQATESELTRAKYLTTLNAMISANKSLNANTFNDFINDLKERFEGVDGNSSYNANKDLGSNVLCVSVALQLIILDYVMEAQSSLAKTDRTKPSSLLLHEPHQDKPYDGTLRYFRYIAALIDKQYDVFSKIKLIPATFLKSTSYDLSHLLVAYQGDADKHNHQVIFAASAFYLANRQKEEGSKTTVTQYTQSAANLFRGIRYLNKFEGVINFMRYIMSGQPTDHLRERLKDHTFPLFKYAQALQDGEFNKFLDQLEVITSLQNQKSSLSCNRPN